ncbi:hypothetical protein PAXRUDRAFT_255334 [Paxillus rubicundulus Ve08.2h10]|uniref:Uncharacterized protein n=1 Tax=Paxillus rubicundulus Ve08.2h10 TaxID=930991 RepID=A0A0D0DN92_9AGAM|nr:hypothetical protein PAXRUDRAFT_255334 [Paxillus rubicundulus Ve08.2h10]
MVIITFGCAHTKLILPNSSLMTRPDFPSLVHRPVCLVQAFGGSRRHECINTTTSHRAKHLTALPRGPRRGKPGFATFYHATPPSLTSVPAGSTTLCLWWDHRRPQILPSLGQWTILPNGFPSSRRAGRDVYGGRILHSY